MGPRRGGGRGIAEILGDVPPQRSIGSPLQPPLCPSHTRTVTKWSVLSSCSCSCSNYGHLSPCICFNGLCFHYGHWLCPSPCPSRPGYLGHRGTPFLPASADTLQTTVRTTPTTRHAIPLLRYTTSGAHGEWPAPHTPPNLAELDWHVCHPVGAHSGLAGCAQHMPLPLASLTATTSTNCLPLCAQMYPHAVRSPPSTPWPLSDGLCQLPGPVPLPGGGGG